MFPHLINFIVRSISSFPSVLSANWTSILLPIVVFLVVEGAKWKKGLTTVKASIGRDTLLLIVAYALLFVWQIGRSVYVDHLYLVQRMQILTLKEHDDLQREAAAKSSLQAQYQNLQIDCARTDGANGQLQSQNRDQQNSINSCLTQAIKMINVPSFSFRTRVVRLGGLFDGMGKHIDGAVVVISTNRTISANAIVRCSQDFDLLSSGSTSNPTLSIQGMSHKEDSKSYHIARISPGWDVDEEFALLVKYTYSLALDFTCATEKTL